MRILVVNAGSSSVKLRVVEADDTLGASRDLGPPGEDLPDRLAEFVSAAGNLDATVHRVVHGGPRFAAPTIVDSKVRAALEETIDLAPLHNPPALRGIDATAALLNGIPTVACFDTAFHVGMGPEASSYAIPASWKLRWGLRRYGFHGLSCAWATARAPQLLASSRFDDQKPLTKPLRLVVCHLGSGASVTAVDGGTTRDTTMGFSPLEGLVMATRPGDLDSAVLMWALRHGYDLREVEDALEHQSGLLGLSGLSPDMRHLLAARRAGDEMAALALSVYVHRLRGKIAGMAAATAGTDAIVFTGGIGENSEEIRAEVCSRLDWMGIRLDGDANTSATGRDANITGEAARVATLVVTAREDLQMAAECRLLLANSWKF